MSQTTAAHPSEGASPAPAAIWDGLRRPVPAWFGEAKLGIFIHWGAYSVPAWAEPTAELGTIDARTWFAHNPYAEWYANTIRIPGSPAARHHEQEYGDAPYDDFLDAWHAEEFDPASWLALFARAGARYVIPTTKHHDGIALWDAPGTGTRNTVARGPRRDLVGALAEATRAAGLRFGVYYSGGLDWSVSSFPPHDGAQGLGSQRPVDAAYNAYAMLHVRDLIARYAPSVVWNDIEWPDFGKHEHPWGLVELFRDYYEAVPDGVVNDRWGCPHHNYQTSEYQAGLENETGAWENCRGLGLSFGYNRVEDSGQVLDGPAVVRHLLDVVSRGGNLLLNVGPDAAGRIPDLQRRSLEQLGDWMAVNAGAVFSTSTADPALARPGNAPWVRWTRSGDVLHAVIDAAGEVALDVDPRAVDAARVHLPDGTPVAAEVGADGIRVRVPAATVAGPVVLELPLHT